MDFIGSPLYYFLCGAAFSALVIWLILLQKKPKKKTPPPPPRPTPSKPRYAAGSDMDRINRNARTIDLEHKPPWDPSPLVGIIIGFLIFLVLFFIVPKL